MFDYTKAAFRKIVNDFKRIDLIRGILTQCVYIAYLIYAIGIGSGKLWLNIPLIILSSAYLIFYVYMRTRGVKKQLKKRVKKAYKWSKRGIKLFDLGIMLYGLSITANHFTTPSLILAALMIVGWVLEILFELIFQFFLKKAKLIMAGMEADYKNTTKPVRAVGSFFKKLTGKQVEPEPEPTSERIVLDKMVAQERVEKQNQKVEKRSRFRLWAQDKFPIFHRKKTLQTQDEQIPAPDEEEILIDLDEI